MLDFSPRVLYTPKKGKSTKKKQLFIIKHCNVGNITTGKHLYVHAGTFLQLIHTVYYRVTLSQLYTTKPD